MPSAPGELVVSAVHAVKVVFNDARQMADDSGEVVLFPQLARHRARSSFSVLESTAGEPVKRLGLVALHEQPCVTVDDGRPGFDHGSLHRECLVRMTVSRRAGWSERGEAPRR